MWKGGCFWGRTRKCLFFLMLCFSSYWRMDGRSKTFRPGERLVPRRTCGTHIQQTGTAEEPEGGAACKECQAAGLLQEIRHYFVWTCTVSLPWGNHIFVFILCLRRNASAKSIIQHFDRTRCFLPKKAGIQSGKIIHFLCVTRTMAAVGGKKGCIYCLLCGNREGLWLDRSLGSGLLKMCSWFCHWQVAGPWASRFRILPQFSHLWNGGKLTYLTGWCEAKFTSISILRALSSWEGRC